MQQSRDKSMQSFVEEDNEHYQPKVLKSRDHQTKQIACNRPPIVESVVGQQGQKQMVLKSTA
jgi:hypothetical protein